MGIKVRSLGQPNNRIYVVTETCEFGFGDKYLSPHVGFFETLGDGDVQHTPLGQAPGEMFQDFCLSMAEHVRHNHDENTLGVVYVLGSELRNHSFDIGDVLLARRVKFRPGKRAWYEERTFRVSSAKSKQYDKRWHEIHEWCDGGWEATSRLVGACKGGSLLYRWNLAREFRDAWRQVIDDHCPNELFVLGLDDYCDYWEMRNAFNVYHSVVTGYRMIADANRFLERVSS